MNKFLKYFVIILPFLDLSTALFTRNYSFDFSPGMIIKGLFSIIMVIYIFKSNSKYGRSGKVIIAIIFSYFLLYITSKHLVLNNNFIFIELTYLLKLFYFPIIFWGLLCYFDDNILLKQEIAKLMKFTLLIYTILLLVPLFTGTAYNTYISIFNGKIGWFFSGNEISNIFLLLIPFMFSFVKSESKFSFLVFLPITYAALSIGTKVSFIALIATVFCALLVNIFQTIKKKSKLSIPIMIIFIVTVFFAVNSYAVKNYRYAKTTDESFILEEENIKKVNYILEKMKNLYDKNEATKILKIFLSSRDIYLANTISIYSENYDLKTALFGIGFSNTEKINNQNILKLIEMDLLDGYFHYGIIGAFIMLSPLLFVAHLCIRNIKKSTLYSNIILLIILMIGGASCFSGHTLTAPAVSIYLIIYLLLFLNEFNLIGRKTPLREKISFLALHMGYGGVEKAITNQANMLCEEYDVEIISLYRVVSDIPYELNDKIKIIYLSNLKPNKQELLINLHNRKLFRTFVEGIKSVYILYMKRVLMIKYVYNSDSDIIISTRLEFNKILNKYGNPNTIKIAEEHTYHANNSKYLKALNKTLINMDYLLPTSEYITNDYKIFFGNQKTTIIYIPNIIGKLPVKMNKCSNKNIIVVARFSKEKGLKDLIDVFEMVINKNSTIKLTIVGDGPERKELDEIIKNRKITNIKFTGFLDQNELINEYKKASLFIMTSYEESFGLVLIEAMSFGIPCFAFSSALGAKEIINTANGKLIENRNKEEMTREILNYFNKKDNKKMIENARKTSLKYSFEIVQPQWTNFIKKIRKGR